MEIDENLCRAELSPSRRTKYTARRKQIWEAMNPAQESLDVGVVVGPMTEAEERDENNSGKTFPTIPTRGAGRPMEFAAETSAIKGCK